jgi:hypothetical protein
MQTESHTARTAYHARVLAGIPLRPSCTPPCSSGSETPTGLAFSSLRIEGRTLWAHPSTGQPRLLAVGELLARTRVRDGEWWKQFAVKSTAFSTLAGPAECSSGDCQSKTPRRCLRCLGVHFARVVRNARNVDGIRIQHASKRLLSACWQQCGVIGDSSASWNSDQGAGRVRACQAISIRLLLVEL